MASPRLTSMCPWALAGILILTSSTPAAAAPVLELKSGALTAHNALPGGQVGFFSVVRKPAGFGSRVLTSAELVRADESGEASIAVDEPVSPQSLWVAVDLHPDAVGGDRVAFLVPTEGIPARRIQAAHQEDIPEASLTREREWIEVFLARPDGAAWTASAGDGNAEDHDGAEDGAVSVHVSSLQPVAASPPSPSFFYVGGDVLLIVDGRTLEFEILEY